MSDPLSDKPRRKRRSHFVSVLSETWKETELRSVIIEDVGAGIMTVILAIMLNFTKYDELAELLFLAVCGGLAGLFLSFAIRFFLQHQQNCIRNSKKNWKFPRKGSTRGKI